MAFQFNQGDRPLPGYTIQRGVGRGGFGEVYYATSDGGKEVALKYLRENPQVELRGVMHCLNLKSPYLVAIHDVKQSEVGDYWVVMEYVSGPSLRELMNNEASGLGAQKAAYFLREIGKGLAYLHDRGIVHRDLKPGNIFYEDGFVKIGDYGLAKIMSASQHSGQTMSVGTVHYMAPEIGSGNYDRTIDIYALGVILYEMLLGKVPYAGATMGEVLMKHLTAQPAVDELPAPFPNVIRKALAKDPKDRYQTVNEMIADVFAVSDIDRSVSGFEPASLTIHAHRAAADLNVTMPASRPNRAGGVAILGDGSSNVGQSAIPPPIIPDAHDGGRGRLERIHDRVQGKLDRLADRIDEKAGRFQLGGNKDPRQQQILAGIVVATGSKRGDVIASTAVTGLLTALAIGFVSAKGVNGLWAAMSSFILMAAVVAGVIFGLYLARDKIKSTSEWTARLLMAGLATAWSASALSVGRIAYADGVHKWFIAVALIMLLSDWIGRFSDGRRMGPSIGRAIKVGIFAFIVASIFDCNVPLVGFSFLVASLLIQKLARGLWPVPVAASAGVGVAAAQPQDKSDAGWRGPEPAVAISRTEDPAGRVAGTEGAASPAMVQSSSSRGLPRSAAARTMWILLAIPLFVVGVLSFIATGFVAHTDVQTATFCIGGVFSILLALFALSRGVAKTHKGFWRSTLRPLIFVCGLAGAASGGIGAGLIAHRDAEQFAFLAGTVLSAAVSLIVWLIPVPAWQPPPQMPEEFSLRRRRRGKWLYGGGIACIFSMMLLMPLLASVLTGREQEVVMPATGIPLLTVGITLCIIGHVAMRRNRPKEVRVKLELPLRRLFEVATLTQITNVLERHLQSIGYKLNEKGDLLWNFVRGKRHAEYWQNNVRQWPTTLNVAAYAMDDGRCRVACYLDVSTTVFDVSKKQIAVLSAELDELREFLGGREMSSSI